MPLPHGQIHACFAALTRAATTRRNGTRDPTRHRGSRTTVLGQRAPPPWHPAPMASWTEELGIRFPIVQAPMAGGPDTPALAAAVSHAGGLGSLGCAYLTAATIEAHAAQVR